MIVFINVTSFIVYLKFFKLIFLFFSFRTPVVEASDYFDSEQVKYGNANSRRCVELFSDSSAALVNLFK